MDDDWPDAMSDFFEPPAPPPPEERIRHRPPVWAAGPEIPEEMLRFGVEFADGRRATNTCGGGFAPPDTEPAGPLLNPGGGGGGPTSH